MVSSSVAVTSADGVNSNLATLMAPAEPLPGEVGERLSRGASTPRGGRASTKTARSSPAPVPATARRGAAMLDNRVHRTNVVTRRAAAELTGAATRHRGVRSNKNNNDDDNNIINNIHAAQAERFQPSTLHKLRQLGLYTNTDTPDDNSINNNNHAALAKRFQPSMLHKVRQLGRYTNMGTPDTAHQLDTETVPVEIAYTRTNTQPSCSGGGRIGPCPEHLQQDHDSCRWSTLRSSSKLDCRG